MISLAEPQSFPVPKEGVLRSGVKTQGAQGPPALQIRLVEGEGLKNEGEGLKNGVVS